MAEDPEARRRRLKAESARLYRDSHGDELRETARRWREANQEHRREYQRRWRADNLERSRTLNRESMRRTTAAAKRAKDRRAAKAEYARKRYHADIEASRAKSREYRDAARARDPEAYRESQKRANDKWRETHRDEINARLREKKLMNPEPVRERKRRYYENHAEERRAVRRRYYHENRDKELAAQRRWRQREKRRIAVGLPVRRLHRRTPDERMSDARAADAFFSQPVTPELVARVTDELRTPPHLIAAWQRECERIRAVQYQLRHPETSSKTINRRQAEEERMDKIAREINERLRTTPRRTAASHAALDRAPVPSTNGLSL